MSAVSLLLLAAVVGTGSVRADDRFPSSEAFKTLQAMPQRSAEPTATVEEIGAMPAERLFAFGEAAGFFKWKTMPRYQVEFDPKGNDKYWLDLEFRPLPTPEPEATTHVDLALWKAYWSRAEAVFQNPATLSELRARNVTIVSYGDSGLLEGHGYSGDAGSLFDPKRYAAATERIAALLRRYPSDFIRAPLIIEIYASSKGLLSLVSGTADTKRGADGSVRVALFGEGSIETVLNHEIAHVVIPPDEAVALDAQIYGAMEHGRFYIDRAKVTTPERKQSFVPNCIQDWGAAEPQGLDNAAEDIATIVENLQCGRLEKVLERARGNSFLRRKVEEIAKIYAARGFDVSSWRVPPP